MYVSFDDNDLKEGGGSVEPGIYHFKIEDIQEKQFKSGSGGLNIQLLVGIGDRDVTVYETIVLNPAPGKKHAKWKLAQLCRSVGVDPEAGVDIAKLLGKVGRAEFVLPDGEKYLRVDTYFNPDKPAAPKATTSMAGIGNVPF